ncbi:hypothetical protein ACJX0J_009084, partial [Zea mays]
MPILFFFLKVYKNYFYIEVSCYFVIKIIDLRYNLIMHEENEDTNATTEKHYKNKIKEAA